MGLKIELKPGERMMLGDCVITNHDHGRYIGQAIESALGQTDVPVPRTWVLCDDPEIIGTIFYVFVVIVLLCFG